VLTHSSRYTGLPRDDRDDGADADKPILCEIVVPAMVNSDGFGAKCQWKVPWIGGEVLHISSAF
jgi:hypothetical protein